MVYGPFWLSENTLPILVWNRAWFSRNLREVHVRMYSSFPILMNKNEIDLEICGFEMHLKNFLFGLKRELSSVVL